MPGPHGIDYSKWNNIDDSDEEVAPPAVHVTVLGFVGRDVAHLHGNYTMLQQVNHRRPVFQRLAEGGQSTEKARIINESVLYYWDERDGYHLCGWWIGPAVGSDMVWAFNPGEASQPPPAGWREPWFYDVSPSARVLLANASIPVPLQWEEVPLPAVAPVLGPTAKRLRKVATVWRCVECLGWLRMPVALPCGHLVCSAHAQAMREAYCCPWSHGCASRCLPCSLGSEGWCTAGVVERLSYILPPPPLVEVAAGDGSAGCGAAPVASDLREAVRRACSPKKMVAAYESLGDAAGQAGRAAQAAAAFATARFLHEEFGGAMDLTSMNLAPDWAAPAIQKHKNLRAKASWWTKRCGDADAMKRAMDALPVPDMEAPVEHSLEELEADVESYAARLRSAAESDAALQAMLECPVCYGTVFEPVVTPCGHSYCRRCLARILDCGGSCPLCRRRLAGYIDNYSVCEPLQDLLTVLWPEAYSRQLQELAAEHRDLREGTWLPIFTSLLALPTQPCNIHIFEPRYRLMIRQALSCGLRCFGACPRLGDAGGHAEYGTELLVKSVLMIADGRSLVETLGARRFRVLESSVQDGYARARVEYLTDVERQSAEAAVQEFLAAFRGSSSYLQPVMAQPLERWLAAGASEPASPARIDELAWTVLQHLPLHLEAKCQFLGMSSTAVRLQALARHLRGLLTTATAEGLAADAGVAAAGSIAAHGAEASGTSMDEAVLATMTPSTALAMSEDENTTPQTATGGGDEAGTVPSGTSSGTAVNVDGDMPDSPVAPAFRFQGAST